MDIYISIVEINRLSHVLTIIGFYPTVLIYKYYWRMDI